MRRLALLLGLLLALSMLASCAPRATLAKPDAKALNFTVLPNGDLALAANAPMEYGGVTVKGQKLKLESPYCELQGCVPRKNGYVRLTFPDEPDADYGTRIVIDVVSGSPRQGRAEMTLSGEEKTRPAPLTLNP